MAFFRHTLKFWLPLAAAITLLAGTIYVVTQQVLRWDLNDPQIQMAEDAARALANGASPSSLIPAGQAPVDIAKSLAPYLIIFDAQGKPLASGATLHGSTPLPPQGVWASARQQGEDRVSWQPEPGVRSAAVIVPVNGGQGGFVLAGRNMREVEARENQALGLVAAGWTAAMALTLALVALFEGLPFTRSPA